MKGLQYIEAFYRCKSIVLFCDVLTHTTMLFPTNAYSERFCGFQNRYWVQPEALFGGDADHLENELIS